MDAPFTFRRRALTASSLGNDTLVRLRRISEERQATYVNRMPDTPLGFKFERNFDRIGVVVAAFDGNESTTRSYVCFDVGLFRDDLDASVKTRVYEHADLEVDGVDAYVTDTHAAALRATAAALRSEVTTFVSTRGDTGTLVRVRVGARAKKPDAYVVDEAHRWGTIISGYPATQTTVLYMLAPYNNDDTHVIIVRDADIALAPADADVDAAQLAAARTAAAEKRAFVSSPFVDLFTELMRFIEASRGDLSTATEKKRRRE